MPMGIGPSGSFIQPESLPAQANTRQGSLELHYMRRPEPCSLSLTMARVVCRARLSCND